MNRKTKHKHYGKMGITPQMSTLTFEAEAIASVVAGAYSIDSSSYSYPYLASWASGKEVKELKDSLERIRSFADEMITGIDRSLEKQIRREQNRAFREEAR